MINSIDTYRVAGEKAGQAMRRGDAGLARHWSQWRSEAIRLESGADRKAASVAYLQGYQTAAFKST